MRGYQPGRFSSNIKGGRCEHCYGDGTIKVEMNFLPDVYVPCEMCEGAQHNRETLDRELIHSTGNEPTREELAQEAGIPVERLAELNAYTKEPVLLDTTLSDEGNTESGDLIMNSDSPSPGVWSAPASSSKAFNGTHLVVHSGNPSRVDARSGRMRSTDRRFGPAR